MPLYKLNAEKQKQKGFCYLFFEFWYGESSHGKWPLMVKEQPGNFFLKSTGHPVCDLKRFEVRKS